MMTGTVTKIQKSDVIHHRSHMTQIQGSYCKGICRKHKSDTPTWSTSEVVYCRTCEMFLKKSGWFTQKRKKCKCCNHLVRNRPRQSVGKAKFDSKKQGNIEWTDPEDAAAIARQEAREKQNRLEHEAGEEYQSNKKATPIYKEEKVDGKTYYEFRNFIEKEIKLQDNYQLVMLKCLLAHKAVHKGKIAESLAHYNNKDPSDLEQVKEFLDNPVYKVLLKSGFVVQEDGTVYNPRGQGTYAAILYKLNGKFDDYQRISLDELLEKKIKEYNLQHGIQEFDYDNETFDPLNWRNYKNRSLLQEENTIADLDEDGKVTVDTDFDGAVRNNLTVRERQIQNREINAKDKSQLHNEHEMNDEELEQYMKNTNQTFTKYDEDGNLRSEKESTNPRPATDRLAREASSAARWAMKKSETSAVSAKEYMQSTKQEKIDKIKGKLAELRVKLSAHGSKPSPVREAPKAPKLTADQKNRIRSGTEYGLPPSTIALDVLGSRRLANIVRIQEYLLSAEYLLQKKSKQKRPLVKQGHRFSTLVKQGHRLKSCPICKKKVCPRLLRVADGGEKK